MEKRQYQTNIVRQVCQHFRAGAKSVLLVAPTGSGKTRMVVNAMKALDASPICLAHRREICRQVEQEVLRSRLGKYLVSGIRGQGVGPALKSDAFDTVFIDEAHHIPAKSYRRVVDNLGTKKLIAATATPYRADSADLTRYFDAVVEAPSAQELTEMGFLANVEYVSSDAVDFEGIKLNRRKDFEEQDALRRVRIAVQAGDMIQAWGKYAKGRNAIIYAINVEHGEAILEECRSFGIPSELVTGRTGKRHRDRSIGKFANKKIRALINCEVFTEGTDVPNVGAIIMLRPTLSRPLYKQMIGRGMRPDVDCVVIDHVGNYQRHGCVLKENPIAIMNEGKVESVASSTYKTIDMSDDYIKMDLHVEKVDVDLSKIWTPSIFGAAA